MSRLWRGIRMMNQQNLNEGLLGYTRKEIEKSIEKMFFEKGESENA